MSSAGPDQLCCPLCNGQVEFLQHLFLSCPLARQLWHSSKWPFNLLAFVDLPFAEWIKAILRPHVVLGLSGSNVQEFQISAIVLMDNIWLSRNKLLFEDAQPVSGVLLKKIRISISHHLEAWCLRHPIFSPWSPPSVGSFKANFDVAIHPSFAVAVAILKDYSENFLTVNTLKLLVVDASE